MDPGGVLGFEWQNNYLVLEGRPSFEAGIVAFASLAELRLGGFEDCGVSVDVRPEVGGDLVGELALRCDRMVHFVMFSRSKP
jgi:hypothetical protein